MLLFRAAVYLLTLYKLGFIGEMRLMSEAQVSSGGDASPRRYWFVKAQCLDKQIQKEPYWQVGVSNPNLPIPTRGRVAPRRSLRFRH